MPGIVAALELLHHVVQRKTKTLFLVETGGGFPRQMWLSGMFLSAASFCCASTDLLSQPRAMWTIIAVQR
jgi:hypothetical protein